MGIDVPEGEEDEGEGGRGEQDGPCGGEYDVHWQRDDRTEWTEELGRAHTAFERGRTWGLEWAICVRRFLDFEAAWGFVEGGFQMPRKDRPQQLQGWISRGRKWTMPPTLGTVLGTRDVEELWVGGWWKWWNGLQPTDRTMLENGGLSRCEEADWSAMAAMHGKNGVLQVMATLGWWGEVVHKQSAEDKGDWLAVVNDVTWVLEQILESDKIGTTTVMAAMTTRTRTTCQEEKESEKEEGALIKKRRKLGSGMKARTTAKRSRARNWQRQSRYVAPRGSMGHKRRMRREDAVRGQNLGLAPGQQGRRKRKGSRWRGDRSRNPCTKNARLSESPCI
ncbi:hypothetical protein K438DRAFT_259255 [Mycena galopus ATCC 62051]|nr:hypothetical protein K438DRAFT_259255 [Mycena galopus ATCC 62051]